MRNKFALINRLTITVVSTHQTYENARRKELKISKDHKRQGGKFHSTIAENEGFKKGDYLTPEQVNRLGFVYEK